MPSFLNYFLFFIFQIASFTYQYKSEQSCILELPYHGTHLKPTDEGGIFLKPYTYTIFPNGKIQKNIPASINLAQRSIPSITRGYL